MPSPAEPVAGPSRTETVLAVGLFVIALVFHGWGMSVGWKAKNLAGNEYRQAQTALSTYWIKQSGAFDLDYPTPVLGKPWSVPMEFPLYQWSVVITSQVTGFGLTKAARLVSMVCFYLSLPALFLLLGRWSIAANRRWLVLAMVVSCPFYVFYARAFLIETMALMFALWFWVAFERAVEMRRHGWLAVAVLAGTGAGLVKVTTFLLYLLPVAGWAGLRLWQKRKSGQWRSDLGWMATILAAPFLATIWWVRKSDQIKALNPLADFLGSAHMRDFNLGTTELRISPEIWAMKWRIISQELTWLPLVAICLLLFLLGGRHRLRASLFCGFCFVAALGVFPLLYAYHDYYYVANTVLLLLAAGLAVVGLTEQPRWWILGACAAVGFVGGQMSWFLQHYYPVQQGVSEGGNALTDTLQNFTHPDEVLVIAGEDWNSMIPYYARRRALMLRGDVDSDGGKIDLALANMKGVRVGACLITAREWREKSVLLERLPALGLDPTPVLTWSGSWMFFPRDRRPQIIDGMRLAPRAGVAWAPGAEPPPELLGGSWHELADLPAYQRAWFGEMKPAPVRFFCSFEPMQQVIAHQQSFSGHPVTRLVFPVKRGAHVLTTEVWFNPDAFNAPAGQDPTDGAEVRLSALAVGGEARILGSRVVNPTANPGDRGPVPIEFRFSLEQDGEVELMFGPGPAGRDTRDWIWIRGPLVIE